MRQIAIVMSEVFVRRLAPALKSFVRRRQDFRILSIHRPEKELCRLLRDLKPDGLITEWLPEVTEALLGLDLPTVIADTDYCYPGVVSVDVDDWAVGAEAARAFQRAGYRSFACLGNGAPYSRQRVEGFCSALDREVPVRDAQGVDDAFYSEHFAAPEDGLREWLGELPKPVAIFAVHDPLGRFLCGLCQEIGLEVPEQVAIMGANNDELVCDLTYPMLSSVTIPWTRIGGLVGTFIQARLEGETIAPGPHLVSPGGVVLRHSANHLAVEDLQLRRAMSYFSERLQDPISVGGMCADLRLARRGIERRFRETFQCTPWEMLCRMRVNRAKALLAGSNHPVSRIAELCGFNDPERLAVVFRRETGRTPTQFRKQRQTT